MALLTAMCVVDRPRVTNIVEAEFISGALVDVNRSRCDMGQLGLIHLGLGVYHAIVATAGCVASFRTRSVSSQCMPTRGTGEGAGAGGGGGPSYSCHVEESVGELVESVDDNVTESLSLRNICVKNSIYIYVCV